MLLPSSCLCFGPPQYPNVTVEYLDCALEMAGRREAGAYLQPPSWFLLPRVHPAQVTSPSQGYSEMVYLSATVLLLSLFLPRTQETRRLEENLRTAAQFELSRGKNRRSAVHSCPHTNVLEDRSI
ncbi:hypothetical protein ATANTOWER_014701 [Ataeniobius toweri]|uniref:Uncharacterized protein n=1 Tax=Ataeniobius toweri TaxID=208326 RepID=A0ABU7BSM5_9TELE|nr:hypothetical protein [Ataeniobius toweri]